MCATSTCLLAAWQPTVFTLGHRLPIRLSLRPLPSGSFSCSWWGWAQPCCGRPRSVSAAQGFHALSAPCALRLRPLWDGLVLFVGVSLTSLFGGLVVAAFLTDLPHLVGVQLFRGVKLAQLLPLVVVAFVFAARSATSYRQVRWETGERGAEWPALRAGLQEVLSYSVRYWHVLAVAFALGLLAMLVMRSGNEPLLPVSGLEIKLRALLDSTLGVRPRTKEIFFAHPLMVLALIWLCRGRRRGLWILLTAGAIGQVSIVNTFCHLHTPLLVSLARACNGLWIGIIGGIILWGLIWLFTRRIVVQSRPADPGG